MFKTKILLALAAYLSFASSKIIGLQSLASSFTALFLGLVYLAGTLNFRRSAKTI